MKDTLDIVSKLIMQTSDARYVGRNVLNAVETGDIFIHDVNMPLTRVANDKPDITALQNFGSMWRGLGQEITSTPEALRGMTPVSGTPLGTTEIVTSQGIGIHEYRQGKIAEFWQEIYRDWVLPHMRDEINKGSKWLDDLTLAELQDVAEKVSTKETNDRIKQAILSGKMVTPEEQALMQEVVKETFMKGGEKRFLEAFKDEFADLPMDVEISIKNKQKNLADVVNKLNSVFRTLFTPGAIQAVQQNKGLSELLNNILESGGMSPVNFSSFTQPMTEPTANPNISQPSPMQAPQLQAPLAA